MVEGDCGRSTVVSKSINNLILGMLSEIYSVRLTASSGGAPCWGSWTKSWMAGDVNPLWRG
jgi:hypothetical protein